MDQPVTRILETGFAMADYTDFCSLENAWNDAIVWADETGNHDLADELLRKTQPTLGTFSAGGVTVTFERKS